jgi:TP901 family phage tail tape measure protein
MAGIIGVAVGGLTVLGVAFGGATKAAGDFGEEMGLVATLLPGMGGRVKALSAEITKLDGDSSELTRGLFQTISAFGDSERAIDSLNESYRAAVAGGSTVKEAVDLQIAATKAFGDTSEQARKRVLDLAFETNRIGVTTFPELANNLGQVTGLASTMGLTIEEVFATFATLTGAIGNTSDSATAFRATLSQLAQGGQELDVIFETLGVRTGQELIAKFGGFKGALDAVAGAAKELDIPLTKVYSNVRAAKGAIPLSENLNRKLADSLDAMGESAGASDQAFKDATTGLAAFSFQGDRLRQRLDKIKILIGAPFAEALGETFGKWADYIAANQNQIVGWGRLIGQVMIVVGKAFITPVAIFKNFIETLALGFESLLAGLVADAAEFGQKFLAGLQRNILDPINLVREALGKERFEIDTSGIEQFTDNARIKQKEFSDAAIVNLKQAQDAVDSLAGSVAGLGPAFDEVLAGKVRDAAAALEEASEGVKGAFSGGGPTTAVGGGSGENPEQEALDKYLVGLQQMQEELGKTERAVAKLRAERLGAGTDELKEIDRIYDAVDAYRQVQADAKNAAAANDRWAESIKKLAQEDIANSMNRAKEQVDQFSRNFSDAVSNIVLGTESIGEAFRGLVDTILAELVRLATQQIVTGLFAGLFNGGGGVNIGNLGVTAPSGVTPPGGFIQPPAEFVGGFGGAGDGLGSAGLSSQRQTLVVEAPVNVNVSAIDSRGAQEVLEREAETIAGIVANRVSNSYRYQQALRG